MNTRTKTKLTVAAVQMQSELLHIKANHKKAEGWINAAADKNAKLVLFPELMPSGYTLSPELWDAAEPKNGPTALWLQSMSKKYQLCIGTSFLEAENDHFHNTFILTNPDGTEAGRVRKQHTETYFFKGNSDRNHVINTPIGRIGVGICADNHYSNLIPILQYEKIDLMLMPHAWPAPFKTGNLVDESDINRQQDMAKNAARIYAEYLGVPAIFVNHCGPTSNLKGSGIVGRFMNSDTFHFPGLSHIADSDGKVLARMENEEGVCTAEVSMDPQRKIFLPPKSYGKWLMPGSINRDILFGIDGTIGKLWYWFTPLRKKTARKVQKSV